MIALSAVDQPIPQGPASSPGTRSPLDVLHVVAWDDPSAEGEGLDSRSSYAERFWLPLLGPTGTCLLRQLADRLETAPDGFDLALDEAARSLGVGARSGLRRAILRCARHGVVRHRGTKVLAVRRRLPPLGEGQIARLPLLLRVEHGRWEDVRRSPSLAHARRRSRLIALDLVAVIGDLASLERRLLRWGVHPALAYETAIWAWERHSLAVGEQAAQTLDLEEPPA